MSLPCFRVITKISKQKNAKALATLGYPLPCKWSLKGNNRMRCTFSALQVLTGTGGIWRWVFGM